MYTTGFTGVLICCFLIANGHLVSGDPQPAVGNEGKQEEVSHPTVQHTIVHVEVPEPNKKAEKFEPKRLCRLLKKGMSPSMQCNAIKWESELSEDQKSPKVDLESLRALLTHPQSGERKTNGPLSASTVINLNVNIEKVINPITKKAMFGSPASTIFDGRGDELCSGLRYGIRSRWSSLCVSNLMCSGLFLEETANIWHFEISLYDGSLPLDQCPDLRNPEIINTLMGMFDELMYGKKTRRRRVTSADIRVKQMQTAVLKLKLEREDWTELPLVGSHLFQMTKAEVSHQLRQIIKIHKIQGTLDNYEFAGFSQDDDGAVVALFLLFFDPLKSTLPELVTQLRNGLAAIRSLRLTHRGIMVPSSLKEEMRKVTKLAVKFETTQPGPGMSEQTPDEEDLSAWIKMFMSLASKRCVLWTGVDKMECTAVDYSPHGAELNYDIIVDREKLKAIPTADLTRLLHCLLDAITAESKNWRMVTSLDAVSEW
ncbi:hypothetical protein CSKR_113109 [Clonorchis sinensis]|uniref:Uncharacterized protein n=1 Tax=Clonorchis sinensis TaxID=79923 RepID=A0A8T1MYH7_CLOSI|nr:hypothetical protein CSKR_113109 [Clonorchis sinensis]